MARRRRPSSPPPAARRGGRFYWVGHGAPGRISDPRNWSRRPYGAGGALPPAGATVVFDGRSGRRETVRVPQAGVWGVETRHVRVEGVADGLLALVLGEEREARVAPRERLRDEARSLAEGVRSSVRRRLGARWSRRRQPPPVRSRRYEPVPEVRVVAPWLQGLDLLRELRERRLQAVRDLRTGVVLLVPRISGAATIAAAPGGGNWNATTTWVGGVVPTASDDVQLASTSGSVTINVNAACRSLDCTGYTATLTHSAAVTLSIGDGTAGLSGVALKLVPGMTYTLGSSTTSAFSLVSTAASAQTITTGGKTLGNVALSGVGGRWQHADAAALANLTVTAGTWDTNSQAVTIVSLTATAADGKAGFSFGSSAITVTGTGAAWRTLEPHSYAPASGAVVTMTGAGAQWAGAGIFWHGLSVVASGSGTFVWNGTRGCVVENLTRTGTAVKTDGLQIKDYVIVLGTLTLGGQTTQGVNRLLVSTDFSGYVRAIRCAAVIINGDVSFKDVAITGAPTWTNSGSAYVSDGGGNSGITATPSAAQTATASASWAWSDATQWTSRVPLAQDDVTVSITAGTPTITLDMPRLGRSVDFSGTTVAAVLSFSVATVVYGNWTVPAAMGTPTGSGSLTFSGEGSYSISHAKAIHSGGFRVDCDPGTYTLASNILSAGGSISSVSGGFSDAGKTVSLGSFAATSGMTFVRNVTLTGSWTIVNSGNVWNVAVASGRFDASACSITFSSTNTSAKNFFGAGYSYGSLTFKATGSGGFVITGSNTFGTLDLECSTARTVTLPAGGAQTVTTSLTLKGAAGQLLSLASSTPGSRAAIAYSPGATVTQSNDSLSADITVATSVSQSAVAIIEAQTGKRTPRTLAFPGSLGGSLIDPTTMTLVVCLVPNFSSGPNTGTLEPFAVESWASMWQNNDTVAIPLSYLGGSWNMNRGKILAGTHNTRRDRLALPDPFVAGQPRLVASAWDVANLYLSAAGAAFVSAPSIYIPVFDQILVGTPGFGIPTFDGTILWFATFSNKLADADVAALNAAYLTSYPDWSDLPGSPTALYRSDWGAYITGEGQTEYVVVDAQDGVVQTDAEAIDALEQLLAGSGDPVEAVGPVAAVDAAALEALLGTSVSKSNPLEALLGGAAVSLAVPWEALLGGISAVDAAALEALLGTSVEGAVALEALRGVAGDAAVGLEALLSVAAARSSPWEELLGLFGQVPLPIESVDSRFVDALARLRLEMLGPVAEARQLPAEALEATGVAAVLAGLEALGGVARPKVLPLVLPFVLLRRRGSGASRDIPVGVAKSSDVAAADVESHDTLG